MSTVMKASEFIEKLKDIEKNYKTLYVMGCFGAPMNKANKERYSHNHEYNRQSTRQLMINKATPSTFGFDCVNLIKAILWGWSGDQHKVYGGAKYASNGVPDINADTMIQQCTDVSTDFTKPLVPGEAVWQKGHIGVYIGDGLAIECTPAWQNKVQITSVNVKREGYKTRQWTKHGKLPYIEYDVADAPMVEEPKATETKTTKTSNASGTADKFDESLAGTYVTTANLNMRNDAGAANDVLVVLPKYTKVKCYGYYSLSKGVKWLYVQATVKKVKYTGFCSSRYLKK